MTQSVATSVEKNKPLTDSLVLNPVFKNSTLTVFTRIAKGKTAFKNPVEFLERYLKTIFHDYYIYVCGLKELEFVFLSPNLYNILVCKNGITIFLKLGIDCFFM